VKNTITYVGIDPHKKDLFVAMLAGTQSPVAWTVPNEPNAVRRLVRKLEREAPGPVRACYEAGPCGYALQRQMTTARVSCQVIAPALVAAQTGRAREDESPRCPQAGGVAARGVTDGSPPTDAGRGGGSRTCVARAMMAREDLQRCRHRLGKTAPAPRLCITAAATGRRRTANGIDSLTWAQQAERVVVEDYLLGLDQVEARLMELDARLTEIAQSDPYREPVAWLRCFRGIDTLTAILILAELHDFRRFQSPRALMAYLGLVPGEDSSGEKHRRGRITRTGNTLVRRLLVETAWHYQHGQRWASRSRAVGKGSRDG